MRDGTCPMCGGKEVHAARSGFGFGGATQLAVQEHIEPGFRGIRGQTVSRELWWFVCTSCGLSQSYLLDGAALGFIRERWPRVTPREAG